MPDTTLRPLDYELPKATKNAMDSWMPRLQAIAIVTVLFAGLEGQLLGSLPERSDHQSAADVIVRFCAYSGLILNSGATLSAVLLIVAMASLPAAARRLYMTCSHGYPRRIFDKEGVDVQELNKLLEDAGGEPKLLQAFGIANGWDILLRHCIFCFIFGCACTFLHIAINIWLSESQLVAAIIMPSVFVGFVPPFVVFFVGMGASKCRYCAEDEKDSEV